MANLSSFNEIWQRTSLVQRVMLAAIGLACVGATVFLVPPQELAVAKAHAGSHLDVLAVSSLSQAVRDLERLGGSLVPPGGS